MCDLGEPINDPCRDTTEVILQQEKRENVLQKIKTGDSDDEETGQIRGKQIFANYTEPVIKIEKSESVNKSEQMDHVSFEDFRIEDKELYIKQDNLESNDNRGEQIFADYTEPVVKIEKSETVNETEEMDHGSFEDFKIKNEELDIKEDNLESNENSTDEHKDRRVQDRQQRHNRVGHKLNGKLEYNSGLFRQSNVYKHSLCKSRAKVKLKCEQCDFQTKYRNNLNRHFLRHTDPAEVDMFKCVQCEFQTIHKKSLICHLLRHRDPVEVTLFKCDYCDYQTKYKNNINRHRLRHMDPEKVNMFKCDQCDFQTKYKDCLNKHLLRHKTPKKVDMFKCDQCDYRSNRDDCLKTHLLQHEDPGEVNTFKCYHCNFQTMCKSYLTRHLLWH